MSRYLDTDIEVFTPASVDTRWVELSQVQVTKLQITANVSKYNSRQIFRIGTVRYAEGLWRMRRHGAVIAHCTDSEDFPNSLCFK